MSVCLRRGFGMGWAKAEGEAPTAYASMRTGAVTFRRTLAHASNEAADSVTRNPSDAAPTAKRTAADFYRPPPVADRRIHIVGVGGLGSFLAHALRGITNPPPVTLIFSRYQALAQWKDSPLRLTLVTDGVAEAREGFDAELAIPRIRHHGRQVGAGNTPDALLSGESAEPITSLLVCAKAHQVVQTLAAVKHRLHPGSVVCFLQNGMGILDDVNRHVFPDPKVRPRYMLGLNSHSIYATPTEPFIVTHMGFGTLSLGILPHERDRDPRAPYLGSVRFKATDSTPIEPGHGPLNSAYPPPSSANFPWTAVDRYLLRTLLRTPVLSAAAFSPPDLLQMQLDKLAVSCIIQPLTTMLDARNGALLSNYAITRTLRLLLAEISLVIRSLPELQYIPNLAQRFDPGRLETNVIATAHRTRDSISTMLADTRAGMSTEIEHYNGWIVRRGEELGIRCLLNYMMVQMVRGKSALVQRETAEEVPFVGMGRIKVKHKVAEAAAGGRDSA